MSSGRLARFFGLIPTPMREYTCVPQVAGKLSEVASSSDIIEILRERGPRSEPVASTGLIDCAFLFDSQQVSREHVRPGYAGLSFRKQNARVNTLARQVV